MCSEVTSKMMPTERAITVAARLRTQGLLKAEQIEQLVALGFARDEAMVATQSLEQSAKQSDFGAKADAEKSLAQSGYLSLLIASVAMAAGILCVVFPGEILNALGILCLAGGVFQMVKGLWQFWNARGV
jgi:hypothetical protein